MTIIDILRAAIERKASDVHLVVGMPPMMRAVGEMVDIPGLEAMDAETCKNIIYSCLREDQRARFEDKLELDASFAVTGLARFRINVLVQHNGVEAVFRVVPSAIPSPEFLGLGPALLDLAKLPSGLVLVTGPTGAGKSTTLACLVDQINSNVRRHIITIEDPIEFIHPPKMSVIRQREVGPHTHSFNDALRHALRQDPDVILVGEMRDLETISLAITAAETGHLVFSTLHTGDASSTVTRIIDVFPAEQQSQVRLQLANSLRAVVSQILLPRSDAKGRIAVREVLINTAGVASNIRDGKIHLIPNSIETGGKFHMYSMDMSLTEMLRRGLITYQDAVANAKNPERVAQGRQQAAGAAAARP